MAKNVPAHGHTLAVSPDPLKAEGAIEFGPNAAVPTAPGLTNKYDETDDYDQISGGQMGTNPNPTFEEGDAELPGKTSIDQAIDGMFPDKHSPQTYEGKYLFPDKKIPD